MKNPSCIFARLFLALATVAAVACAPAPQKITIIAVNDIHGSMDNFPSLATLVNRYRAADPAHTLLIDAGDRWTGNPFVDLDAERGQPIILLMNKLGFNLASHGNHEFDFGLEVLAKRIGESQFPYVGANIDSNGSLLPQPEPYRCFEIDGAKICVLGLISTARGGYPDGFVENFGSIRFSHPVATALGYRNLRDSCDVLVALTHMGYELDSVLALQMPELDLIIGAHTHSVLPHGSVVSRTLVTQGGSRLQYADVITLTLRRGKLVKSESSLVRLDTIAPDPEFAALVQSYKNRPELNEVQGTTGMSLDRSGVMNMVSDLVRKRAGTDFVLYNWGGIRVDSLRKGEVTLADVYSIEPFGNSINIVKMSLGQIKEIILNKFNSTGKESHREDLYPSGFTYHVRTNLKGDGIDVIIETTAKPSPTGLYTVAMSDYLSETYTFSAAGTGEPTGLMLAPLLIEHFHKNSPVHGDNTPRITIGR